MLRSFEKKSLLTLENFCEIKDLGRAQKNLSKSKFRSFSICQ